MNEEPFRQALAQLQASGNLRQLPDAVHDGRWMVKNGQRMLNLSSNDYLGLSTDSDLQQAFLRETETHNYLFSASSSRLLTGNHAEYTRLENLLAGLFKRESALVFSSGYHMNTGIIPAITDSNTLILADKLVHASLIDGIRLSSARNIRFHHQDYTQLERLLEKYHKSYSRILIVTESIFSMDGDVAPLYQLADMKKRYKNVMLYVDEAHAIGVRGKNGLGIAEEQNCIAEIDFLCGTFGKALSSVGAYVVSNQTIRDYLINHMRTLIFTTALPPINLAWTSYIVERLADMTDHRKQLQRLSASLRKAICKHNTHCVSTSHIVPYIVGTSVDTVIKAEEMQRKGFYVLPVRPPTVPEGSSRLRFSLTAGLTEYELQSLIQNL